MHYLIYNTSINNLGMLLEEIQVDRLVWVYSIFLRKHSEAIRFLNQRII